MTKAEIEAALQTAFSQCDASGCFLSEQQKQILLEVAETLQGQDSLPQVAMQANNPLDELTPEQCQVLLEFVAKCEQLGKSWKISLLNDWLHGRDSGYVQFIRNSYGLQWLDSIEARHLAAYDQDARSLKVKVGDRLEVSNGLWEWVPQTEIDDYEWISCTVIRVFETSDSERACLNCTVRLNTGLEYDVEGMYDWNRSHWRWPQA